MKVEHFLGSVKISNIQGLKEVLSVTNEKNENEFWISGIDDYPCLCISINNELAHVHYFEVEGEPGFQAIGHLNLKEEIIMFITNNNERVEIDKEFVLKKEDAVKIACDFYECKKLPESIEWDEL